MYNKVSATTIYTFIIFIKPVIKYTLLQTLNKQIANLYAGSLIFKVICFKINLSKII